MSPVPDLPAGPGLFVCIVGPSGAGKDTLLSQARAKLAADPRFVFAKRTVTRQADPSAEDHDSVSPARFRTLADRGDFCLTWHAHGLDYGIPSKFHALTSKGKCVIANVSRSVLQETETRFARALVINVTANPSILAGRLVRRGRETTETVEKRLARAVEIPHTGLPLWTLDNSGSLNDAIRLFVNMLRQAALPPNERTRLDTVS